MATTRNGDSKAAMGQQRANLRLVGRRRQFVGAGAREGRLAEVAKVRRMQEAQRARAEAEDLRPMSTLVADLIGDGVRLARTLVAFPFRMAVALRGHPAREA
jgi:hypothetical protein